jgi:hypothetical protein
MSNPFLRINRNNRFRELYTDAADSVKQSPVIKKEKDKEKDKEKEVTENIFTRPPLKKRHNEYRNKNRHSNIIAVKKPEYTFEDTMFPVLIDNTQQADNLGSRQNFKDIVNTKTPLQSDNSILKPGWVEITRQNGANVYKYGPTTKYQKQMEARDEFEASPHYIMNTAIDLISANHRQYIQNYNSIHGDNAYEERYRMESVYGPEYDSETESEDDDDEEEF